MNEDQLGKHISREIRTQLTPDQDSRQNKLNVTLRSIISI